VAGLLALRDAIASLPPIPTAIWLGGAVLVLMCGIARTLWTARWIARSLSADPHTRAMVRELAEEIRLTRVPETVFVDQFVSPLIWCGIKPRLVLPVELWRSLDDASRRAVIVHELAHLKRRDHRVCWVEFVIGALYWWHPVVGVRRLGNRASSREPARVCHGPARHQIVRQCPHRRGGPLVRRVVRSSEKVVKENYDGDDGKSVSGSLPPAHIDHRCLRRGPRARCGRVCDARARVSP
jgi:8-oxo-dGTP pyrophosphatase MutT (NUDIX family)